MKKFFDTSVLVASFQEHHPHHRASMAVVSDRAPGTDVCAAHSLAEVYAVLTRIPAPQRLAGADALRLVALLRRQLRVVALTADEYADGLAVAAGLNLVGGAVYDLLLAQCALKAGADEIYTWNVRDFERCGPEVARRMRTPGKA